MTGSEIVVKTDICFTWTEHKQEDFTRSRITPFPFKLVWKLLCICDVNMHLCQYTMKEFVPFDPNMLGHSLLLSIFSELYFLMIHFSGNCSFKALTNDVFAVVKCFCVLISACLSLCVQNWQAKCMIYEKKYYCHCLFVLYFVSSISFA